MVQAALALEPGVAEGEAGRPHALELRADDELRALRSVRIDRHLRRRLLDFPWSRATLDASEVEVGLVVNSPELVGDQ